MKPSRPEILLFAAGALLVFGGAVARLGHWISTGLGFVVLLVGIACSIGGRVLTGKRARAPRAQGREVKLPPTGRRR